MGDPRGNRGDPNFREANAAAGSGRQVPAQRTRTRGPAGCPNRSPSPSGPSRGDRAEDGPAALGFLSATLSAAAPSLAARPAANHWLRRPYFTWPALGQ
ncbi:unnamed protein product [Rangifer tarandus platyrhynchus]|uniref:Uncharacterized protein n=2 Tax=Rangifer tarandus platyrhynchus TaxID=3082113 RepID=A0ACB0F4Z3_RANTA|nr:unnamed protein product [Rangifer tarandus platyrhynchus]CAI9707583.1 unnamed protein product [Rangifer tarandus platyrhynchus]